MEAVPARRRLATGLAPMIVRRRGSVADLHALDPFAEAWSRRLGCGSATRRQPAIVLGSRQTPDVLDVAACAAARSRRRAPSVGRRSRAARPASTVWVDVVVPAAGPRREDDVRQSMVLGRRALARGSGARVVGRGRARPCTRAEVGHAVVGVWCASPASPRVRCCSTDASWSGSASAGPAMGPAFQGRHPRFDSTCDRRWPTCSDLRSRSLAVPDAGGPGRGRCGGAGRASGVEPDPVPTDGAARGWQASGR